ncbi:MULTISPECIES: DotD/TraH family lipoprotein [Vibrio]|uniref:DotD/TraH family lipoprotein n=3 Tax=Vibrio TaxID=662 RepID=A0AB38NLD9_9VIBR|nr:DotD/TraH family lipoprotein [Vibrio tasmaniensis]TKG29012.1 hypothetical protein FC057_20210 [Vibrio tasmaniensis]TKG41589.1 hypothetical protein FC063_06940 [Vibrio tasmaniensis]TKG46238.1 hypothetical protein FC070_22405 [Vibrio tasmaniensis]TKG50647.1 hypothetical protein FC060_06015 [Vibrio tasmaniensis]TKG56265.1 hypothetical protein FC061_02750 [Vibrio tasmaniensis]
MRRILQVLIFSMVMSGCQSTSVSGNSDDKAYISKELETTLAVLAEKAVASKKIAQAHTVAMARLNPQAKKYTPNLNVPEGLERIIPMNAFYGKAEEPLQLIAQLTDYEYKEFGAKNNTETLWVKLQANSRSAIDIVDDISNQIDNRGVDVHVWETPNEHKKGVIMINYGGGL